jgi:hypothetical protein
MVAETQSPPRLRVVEGGRARSEKSDAGVRWDKVRSVRARISTGYYDRPDVRERVLTAVLDELEDR